MFKYHQRTGAFYQDDKYLGTGYSGTGEGKNNPSMQSVKGIGPIPRGMYKIGKPYRSTKGPCTMQLTPEPGNVMFGRASFLIHGDRIKEPGTASQGCIILSRGLREFIAEQVLDSELLVTV